MHGTIEVMNTLVSVNPASDMRVGEIEITSPKAIETAVAAARNAQEEWKALGTSGRVNLLRPLVDIFRRHGDKLALLITQEMGKPLAESRAEILSGCGYLEWFLDNAESALQTTVTKRGDHEIHTVSYEPIGTAAVILPWNFPFDIFIWGVMTNLLAGNTVVAKHSEHCPLTGRLLETLLQEARLPPSIFSEVYGDGSVGSALAHQPVDLIWFTGSSATGKKLYELGGQKMIKVLLEMGGSNPTIVFEDVVVSDVESLVATKRFLNCGQACSALKRLLVHESLFVSMTEAMKRSCESKIIGDPEDATVTLGPLVSVKQAETLAAQVQDAVDKGATVVTGGDFVPGHTRAYYQPTVLTNVTPDMRVWHEEVFGPVLPIVPFKDEQQAIALAEDSIYGLGAQIYSKDLARARRVAAALKVGNVEINGISRRIPCNPFGGCKASGMGREHGVYGFHEVSELKCISMPVG